ncbi:IRE protein kinase [Tremella mesenterica]|uniref:non-specific serine/threonine protein kinase n=1 Tax=Tremella mesenterica TaxID=5217 RepID=A0A4Q1BL37_TREME|nr:IRE protein kinase [Tremella mesenterica]
MNPGFLIGAYLLILLLPLLVCLRGEAVPDPYPAVVSLPPTRSPRHLTPSVARPEVDYDLLPFVLVSTIDGALHAVDRDGGKIRWTLSDGVDPLVGGGFRGRVDGEEYIVEPLSGGLFVFEEEDGKQSPKVRRLPLSVEQLIELSPFTFPHSPGRIFTGSKQSSLLTLDLRTGQQLDCFTTLSANLSQLADDGSCDADLDDLESRPQNPQDILFVGRTDYRLTIHSSPAPLLTGEARSPRGDQRGVQEIVYSTYLPNSYDRPMAEYWAKSGMTKQLWEADGTEAKRLRVELGHDGVAVGVEHGGGMRWVSNLGSIGIAVYDILLPLTSGAKPILVPQPPPHLPSLFPLPAKVPTSQLDIRNRPPTTYIGALPLSVDPSEEPTNASRSPTRNVPGDSSSHRRLLYALSSDSYPLINFAPPPRPGTLANGSFLLTEEVLEQDQLLPYLLDPPKEEVRLIEGAEEHRDVGPKGRRTVKGMWPVFMLGALVSLGAMAVGITRWSKSAAQQHITAPTEKTPLLVQDVLELQAPNVVVTPPEVVQKRLGVTFETPKSETGDSNGTTLAPSGDLESGNVLKKKPGRRRVRGKKKKRDSPGQEEQEGGEDEAEYDDRGEGSSTSPSPHIREKPLPDLPRQLSTVNLKDENDKESLIISDSVIGFGSHGTVVLKGTWGGRPVAVKRLLSDFTRLASQEVKLLQASDDHPNVIRYYCQERRDNFLYIALDLCQASLADLMESPDKYQELASALDRKKALVQVMSGLNHLHAMKIIHRDIKPQNVLVSQAKDGSLRMLVSDFGLARRLEQDQSSFAPTANNVAGSLGWRAPECIRGQVRLNEDFDPSSSHSHSSSSSSTSLLDFSQSTDDLSGGKKSRRLTKAVDLFALGCLCFWVLMSGEHPYGETYNRESNIVKGEIVNLPMLDILGEEGWEAKALITALLSMNPETRPGTEECLSHPFFWTAAKRLSFLCDASDRFENMELDPPDPTLVLLEADAPSIVGTDWYTRLDRVFINNLGKYRKYKGHTVRDLLRAMRNKKHHYQDLEPSVKRHLGSLPSGFLSYFTTRYPTLFLHVYGVVKGSELRHEAMFDIYFRER